MRKLSGTKQKGPARRRIPRGFAIVVLASLASLAGCQTTTTATGDAPGGEQPILIGGKQVPLPETGYGPWRTVVDRTYETSQGTTMRDVILIQQQGRRIATIVWATANTTPQPGARGWRLASFCNGEPSTDVTIVSGQPNGHQDCWAIRDDDKRLLSSGASAPTALREFANREGLVWSKNQSTVSFHYANATDIEQVSYTFAADRFVDTGSGSNTFAPKSQGDLRQWVRGFHVKVRLGFHGLLGRDTIPTAMRVEPTYYPGNQRELPAPEHIGKSGPQPRRPLFEIKGPVGDRPSRSPTTENLIAGNFERLVFQTEFGGPYPWLRKWNRNPVLRISPALDADARTSVVHNARMLEALTGLEFTVEYPTAQPDPDPGAAENKDAIAFLLSAGGHGPTSCFARFLSTSDGTIRAGVVMIGPGLDRAGVDECIAEEFAQVMGPVNDTTFVAQSLFNDQTNGIVTKITWHDAIILRTLYDPRLRPGMPMSDAMPIARNVIAGLLAE